MGNCVSDQKLKDELIRKPTKDDKPQIERAISSRMKIQRQNEEDRYRDEKIVHQFDQRVQNLKAGEYPYNCIGFLRSKRRMGATAFEFQQGTGFLIAPNLVLTAAHNVIDGKDKLHFDSVFYPGVHGPLTYKTEGFKVKEVKISSKFLLSRKDILTKDKQFQGIKNCYVNKQGKVEISLMVNDVFRYDFAILLLEKEVKRERYIMLGQDLPEKIEIEACGYPGDKIVSTVKQYGAKGKINKIYNGVIYHDIDTMKGQSGSPILSEYVQGYYFALGVHVKFHNKEDINCACQLTEENTSEIKQMIKELVGESTSFKIIKLEGLRLPIMPEIQLPEEQIETDVLKKLDKLPDQQMLKLVLKTGSDLHNKAHYSESIQIFQQGMSRARKRGIERTVLLGQIHNMMGLNYEYLKNYTKSLYHYDLALKIYDLVEEKESRRVAGIINNMGIIYEKVGQSEKAIEMYERALRMKRIHRKTDSNVDIGSTLLNIGNMNWNLQKYREAMNCYGQAEQNYTQLYGAVSFQVATITYTIGNCLFVFGRSLEGLDCFYKAIKIMILLKLIRHPYYKNFIEQFKEHVGRELENPEVEMGFFIKTMALINDLFAESDEMNDLKAKLSQILGQ